MVTRYRIELENRHLALSTIPSTSVWRLLAGRLAFEAADTWLLRAELAAGIQRVQGAKKIEVKPGNWLTADQSWGLPAAPSAMTLSGRRERAIVAALNLRELRG